MQLNIEMSINVLIWKSLLMPIIKIIISYIFFSSKKKLAERYMYWHILYGGDKNRKYPKKEKGWNFSQLEIFFLELQKTNRGLFDFK